MVAVAAALIVRYNSMNDFIGGRETAQLPTSYGSIASKEKVNTLTLISNLLYHPVWTWLSIARRFGAAFDSAGIFSTGPSGIPASRSSRGIFAICRRQSFGQTPGRALLLRSCMELRLRRSRGESSIRRSGLSRLASKAVNGLTATAFATAPQV